MLTYFYLSSLKTKETNILCNI